MSTSMLTGALIFSYWRAEQYSMKSAAGNGSEKKNPCTNSTPAFFNIAACAAVSTPSTMTLNPEF
jgi:hypothetical protein